MIFERVTAGIYATNCYIIGCENTGDGVIIDPGGDSEQIMRAAAENGLNIKYIILTHGHFDHTGALKDVKEQTKAPVAIHPKDAYMLQNPHQSMAAQAGQGGGAENADIMLEDGDILDVGDLAMEIMHTPGHTAGGISIKIGDDLLISGDTLFAGSVGRTDLPGGDYDTLIRSIKTKLMVLDENTKVYPGHGGATTIGKEKKTNPFL